MEDLEEKIRNVNRKNRFNRVVVKPAKKIAYLGKKLKTKVSDFYNYITSDMPTRKAFDYSDEKLQVICEDRYQEYLALHNEELMGRVSTKVKYDEDKRYKVIKETIIYTDFGPLIKTKKSRYSENGIGSHPWDEEMVTYEGFLPDESGNYVYTIARSHRSNRESGLRDINYSVITRDRKGKFHTKDVVRVNMMKIQDKTEYCEDFSRAVNYYTSKANEKKYMKVSENEL